MKARRSNRKITPHGGIVPILELIRKKGIPQAIRGILGKRVHWATYEYDEAFIAMVLTILCGGNRIDHITKLRKKLDLIPDLKLPSHDTLGRVMKKLATQNMTAEGVGKKKITYTAVNDNLPLNEMLIKLTKKLDVLNSNRNYTLDIDATFVNTRSKEAKKNNNGKHTKFGHAPMVCLIGKLPVYISLRSGNAGASLRLKETLDDCLSLLDKNDIKVTRVRSDAALGISTKTMDFLHERGLTFVTRKIFAKHSPGFTDPLKNAQWNPIRIKTFHKTWDCEISDFKYKMWESGHTYRIVVLRTPDVLSQKLMETPEGLYCLERNKAKIETLKIKDLPDPSKKKTHDGWVNYEGYDYKVIITNDFKESPQNLILEYNKRGGAERNFDHLKNNSGWKIPPFMRLNENSVYLIVTALANNVFRASIDAFKEHVPGLYINCNLATFQFIFIDVACEYIKGEFVFYNTDIAFEKIC